MKLLLLTGLIAFSLPAQEPGERSVYLLPMANGLDQYIAASLTAAHVFQVVTDPKSADLILTDQVGQDFEQRMSVLYPDTTAKKDTSSEARPSFKSSHRNGTLFLVDRKSRVVMWSDYEKPGNTSAPGLNRKAARVVKKLQESTQGAKRG